ncbi:MAG: hypothetical protein LBC52_08105 [Treponema sp.]|nr:hypothetical protein [Treponema sp.]
MKKYAIAIIGLVFAALVFGSCKETGGTIVVKNGSSDAMLVAVGEILPNLDNAFTLASGESKSFSFDKDALYTIGYLAVGSSGVSMKTKTQYLSGGETKPVTIP